MDSLIHLVYASTATQALAASELFDLLHRARANNARLSVTGMLLHESGHFFQVLEGPPATVQALFQTISRDARHCRAVKIIEEPIARRSFADWTMGFASVSGEALRDIEGLNDFFGQGQTFLSLGPGRAQRLLAAFRAGRWRQRLALESSTA